MRHPNDDLVIASQTYTIQELVYESLQNESAFYRAIEHGLNRKVGIKEVHCLPVEKIAAFREVTAMTGLQHPGVPQVLKAEWQGDTLFVVMTWLEGTTLANYLTAHEPRQDPAAYREGLRIAIGLCRILEAVHRTGCYHRDLKPQNVILVRGEPRLIDFGLTAVPRFVGEGSDEYASPEQSLRKGLTQPLGPQVDIFALGKLLYVLLAGTPRMRAGQHGWVFVDKPSELNRALPEAVDHVLLKAVAYRPDQRYPRVLDLRRDLERLLELRATAGQQVDEDHVVRQPEPPRSALCGVYNEPLAGLNCPRNVARVLATLPATEEHT